MTTLTQASSQLLKRSDDECFENIGSYYNFLKERAQKSRSVSRNISETHFSFEDKTPILTNKNGQSVELTDWSTRQLLFELGIPAQYLNKCPKDLAEDNVNYFLARRAREIDSLFLDLSQERPIVRAITSEQYDRIYDAEVVNPLLDLGERWEVPLTWDKKPRGLYAGDRDMFAFMIDGGSFVTEKNVDGGLHKGFFLRNSEVKNGSFSIKTFLHRGVCGNHIVWGVSNVSSKRVVHRGNSAKQNALIMVHEFLESFVKFDEKKLEEQVLVAKRTKIAPKGEEVIETVRKITGLGKKVAQEAYLESARNISTDGDPRSFWGFVGGLTRLSQKKANADERTKLDAVAGILMETVNS